MSTGEQEITCDFIGNPNQYDWLKISIQDRNNHVHSSVYDSYGGDSASYLVEKLTPSNVNVGNSFETRTYDFTDYIDRYEIYKNFLAYKCNGSSLHGPVQYKDSTLIRHQPSEGTYTGSSGYGVYIDLRKSKGYTNLDERADRSDHMLRTSIRLKNAASSNMVVKIYGIGLGQYKERIRADGTEIIDHWSYSQSGLRTNN